MRQFEVRRSPDSAASTRCASRRSESCAFRPVCRVSMACHVPCRTWNQSRAPKLGRAYRGLRYAPCLGRCDLNGCFDRPRGRLEIFGVVDLTSKIETRISAISLGHAIQFVANASVLGYDVAVPWSIRVTGHAKPQEMGLRPPVVAIRWRLAPALNAGRGRAAVNWDCRSHRLNANPRTSVLTAGARSLLGH